MAAFSQWLRAGRPVRRITWACGPERILTGEVAAAVRTALPGHERAVLTAGDDSERDIWAACSTYPADPAGGRLVIVHEAQRLRQVARELPPLARAGRELASCYLLFLSADPDLTMVGAGHEGKRELAPHLAAIRDSKGGQLIRCSMPGEDALLEWVAGLWPGAGRNIAHHLLVRTGGDLAAVRDACAKASAARLKPSEQNADGLAGENPGDDFTDILIAGSKRQALAAAAGLGHGDIGRAVALLESRLDTLGLLHLAAQRHMDARDISVKLGVSRFLAERYRKPAAAYGPARVHRCRQVLAVADGAWRSGITAGVPEMICALW